jgi:hypothetical protein
MAGYSGYGGFGGDVRAFLLMKTLAVVALTLLLVACPPTPAPPGKNACDAITIPAIGPGMGSQTLCVLPSECREDTMAVMIDGAFCADKSGGTCPAGNAACSNACTGQVVASGLKATACSWDRNSECKTTSGAAGGKCSCTWTIPAGGSLQCGCGCR